MHADTMMSKQRTIKATYSIRQTMTLPWYSFETLFLICLLSSIFYLLFNFQEGIVGKTHNCQAQSENKRLSTFKLIIVTNKNSQTTLMHEAYAYTLYTNRREILIFWFYLSWKAQQLQYHPIQLGIVPCRALPCDVTKVEAHQEWQTNNAKQNWEQERRKNQKRNQEEDNTSTQDKPQNNIQPKLLETGPNLIVAMFSKPTSTKNIRIHMKRERGSTHFNQKWQETLEKLSQSQNVGSCFE